jgi:hypothetical protein
MIIMISSTAGITATTDQENSITTVAMATKTIGKGEGRRKYLSAKITQDIRIGIVT